MNQVKTKFRNILQRLLIVSAILLLNGMHLIAQNNSKFVSQNVQTSVNPGQNFNASFTFKNTGSTTWYINGDYSWWLGSENPRDNFTWGTNRAGRVNTTVSPGQSYTFNGSFTAPVQDGEYNFQWQMLQNYVEWPGSCCGRGGRHR